MFQSVSIRFWLFRLFFHQKLKFFLISLPGIDLIKKHNPFNVQTSSASKILIVVFLFLPFLYSVKVKKSGDKLGMLAIFWDD